MMGFFDSAGKTYLINDGCQKAVDIAIITSCANGSNIHLWQYHGGSNQEFTLYNDIIYNPTCNTAIDNYANLNNNGNNIISYDINLTTAQQWVIEYV